MANQRRPFPPVRSATSPSRPMATGLSLQLAAAVGAFRDIVLNAESLEVLEEAQAGLEEAEQALKDEVARIHAED